MKSYQSSLRILLVEDSESDVMIAKHALGKSGVIFRLDIARDGREALDFLYERKTPELDAEESSLPQLVLLDMGLPRVSGLSVLTQMKADPLLRTIPVVVLTDSTNDEQCRACMELGAKMYLFKQPLRMS